MSEASVILAKVLQVVRANFDRASGKFVNAKEGSLQEEALIAPDRNNFAPRFGFAYSATSKTVIRGAYGIFYNHTNRLGREGLLGFNPPFIILADSNIAGSGVLRSTDAIFRLQVAAESRAEIAHFAEARDQFLRASGCRADLPLDAEGAAHRN